MTINTDTVYFAKTNEYSIIPNKRDEDGCYDICACIDTNIIIMPHEVKLIPTGICSAFSSKYRLAIRERGSNTKSCLITMAGQVDSGYRGEIFVALYNGNEVPMVLTNSILGIDKTISSEYIMMGTDKAIAQFAMEEVPNVIIEEISIDELKSISSIRGEGCLGSSNK